MLILFFESNNRTLDVRNAEPKPNKLLDIKNASPKPNVTLDVKNAGPKRVRSLVDAGVRSVDQLLRVTPEQFATIAGIGPTLSNQFYEDIHQKITNVSIAKIMDASGMFPRIGERRFEAILEVHPNFLAWSNEDPALIANYIRGVRGFNALADDIAIRLKSFTDWLQQHPMITIERQAVPNVQPAQLWTMNIAQPIIQQPTIQTRTGSLTGVTVVFSGFRDKPLEEQIRQRGGKVTTAVSRNTTFLIMKDVNDRKGKANDAEAKGVRLISREEFVRQYI